MPIVTNNYALGRGYVFFTDLGSARNAMPIGNCPAFNISVETNSLDHFSSLKGVREKDASVELDTTRTATITCDNISTSNLETFFYGSTSILSTAAGSVTAESLPLVKKGSTQQLGIGAGNPTGLRNLSPTGLVVKSTGGTPITYVAGLDYFYDPVLGTIDIPLTSTILDNSNLVVDYVRLANIRSQTISGSVGKKAGLKFTAYNAAGNNFDYFAPNVTIRPNGDLSLINQDNWAEMSFNVEILVDPVLGQALYIDGRPML